MSRELIDAAGFSKRPLPGVFPVAAAIKLGVSGQACGVDCAWRRDGDAGGSDGGVVTLPGFRALSSRGLN